MLPQSFKIQWPSNKLAAVWAVWEACSWTDYNEKVHSQLHEIAFESGFEVNQNDSFFFIWAEKNINGNFRTSDFFNNIMKAW